MTLTTTIETIKQRNLKEFKHLSNFKNLKDFNNQFEQAMIFIKHDFTKAELVALRYFRQRCAKVVGVTNARIAIMVSDSHKEGMGISRSTFERMLNKAEALGLITRFNTERKNGSQSSNVYAFNRYDSVVKPTEEDATVSETTTKEVPDIEQLTHLDTELSLYASQESQELSNRREKPVSDKVDKLDSSYIFSNIPKEFIDEMKQLDDDATKINRYWKRALWAGKELFVHNQETLVFHATRAYRTLKHRVATIEKPVKNEFGYFYNTLIEMLSNVEGSFRMPARTSKPVADKTVQPLHIDNDMDSLLNMMDEEWATV